MIQSDFLELLRAYRAQDIDELIEILLRSLDGNNVCTQLRSRGIKRVTSMNCGGALLVPKHHGAFEMFLGNESESWPLCLGHELAHTFFYRFPLTPGMMPQRIQARRREEEEFCETFAHAWEKRGNNLEESQEFGQKLFENKNGALHVNE